MAKKKSINNNLENILANESVIDSEISNELEQSILSYSIKTITDRAIPDIRDGLKPVQRRILYGCFNEGIFFNKHTVKSAEIIGSIMGKLHPHGDSSIYEALTNMSQSWSYRYPLISFQGNNGSIDGDGAASMRYTEAKLSKIAEYCLYDVDKNGVPMKQNYSEKMLEPEVLPGMLPNFLINGSYGIATGYTTNSPSHNLSEIVDGIIIYLKNKNCTIDDLMKKVHGPDFAGGGQLLKSGIKDLYENGKGTITVKAKYEIEQNEETDNVQIIFNELPPDTNKPKLVEKLYELCIEKKTIPRVIDVRDESDGNGVRIVIELHKTAVVDIVIKELYSKTPLVKNSSFIMRAIINKTPKMFSLKEAMVQYVEHRIEVITNRTKYDLNINKNNLHIQEGLYKVSNNIKKAVDIITNSESVDIAKKELMSFFQLTEVQVNEVLEIKLRQLTKINKQSIEDLIAKIKQKIAEAELILSSTIEVENVIVKELLLLKKEFGDERRTIVVENDTTVISENVSVEPASFVLTNKNSVKCVTTSSLKQMFQNKSLKERNELYIQAVEGNTNNDFVLILNSGEYVNVSASDLIASDLNFIGNKKIIKMICVDSNHENKIVFIITKNGIIKKTKLSSFKAKSKRIAPLIEIVNDEIVGVEVYENKNDNIITVIANDGQIHRFYERSFKDTNAGGKGISSMALDGNVIIGVRITSQSEDEQHKIILFTKHDTKQGIKAMTMHDFKPKGRIAQGISGINFGKNKGIVDKMMMVKNNFFTIDSKGIVNKYILDKIEITKRNTKDDVLENEVSIVNFSEQDFE